MNCGIFQIVELEGRLKHEQLMHTVTKNQLKSLEDENIKLRKRILSTPRRRNNQWAHEETGSDLGSKIRKYTKDFASFNFALGIRSIAILQIYYNW